MVVGVGTKGVAQLSHECGRDDAAACDVTDAEVENAVGPPDRVVPVPADLEAHGARLVTSREIDSAGVREVLREEAPLEQNGYFVIAL